MSFKDDLKIDKYSLDEEWLKQPSLFLQWAEETVEAQSVRDRCKDVLDLTRAELDSDVRSNPLKYGLDKITEGAIQNIIIQNVRFREVTEKHLVSIKEAKILDVAREAFEHKRKALEALTQLYLSGYWSSDRPVKGDVRDFLVDSKSAKVTDNLSKNKRLMRTK
jgi:hypothetical protein